jgi:hypothetical protein
MTGDSTAARLDRVEEKVDLISAKADATAAAASAAATAAGIAAAGAKAAVVAATAAHVAATEASTGVRNVSDSNARHIEALKVAIIGGGPILPDDRGALGQLNDKLDRFVEEAAQREARGWANQVSKRNFTLSMIGILVMFAGVASGVIWNFISLHH